MLYFDYFGEKLSKISLGTAPFGTGISKDRAFEIMDCYFKNGGNLLDTARIYSGGMSEKIVGEWIRARNCRESVLISTKGVHPHGDWIPRVNRQALISDLDESLKALNTGYIDIYFLHRDDETVPVSEIMPTLHEFVLSGKVRFLGASNWRVKRIEEANQYAKENGLTPFSFSQIMWSAATINPEGIGDKTLVIMNEEEYKGYESLSIPVMAYTSQAQGFFSHLAEKGYEALPHYLKDRYGNPETLARAEKILALAKERSLSPTAVSLGYLLYDKVESLPIVGISSVKRMEEVLEVFSLSSNQYK